MPARSQSPILGLHHVTATVDAAQDDLDFAVGALGLRLLKKTVNFDNHHVYHFYYGDEGGTPGTIWTTFPYKGHGVPVGRKGAGQITVTSFSIPRDSIPFWKSRLGALGIAVEEGKTRFAESSILCIDPSGLAIELVASTGDDRRPWTAGGVPPETAIRGLHSVTLTIPSPAQTLEFMTGVLGFEVVNQAEGRIRLAVNGDEPGKRMEIVHPAETPPALNGLGTVHHVAMAVPAKDEQLHMREKLVRLGHRVTPVLDRQYFQSIYFREPGGVLFEIATMQPGFAVDEPLDRLGESLKLPSWEEPNRALIERGLAPVTTPRARSRAMTPHTGQPVISAGVPLGKGRAAVIMVHGRNASPANILDLVPRLNCPEASFLAPAAAGNTWYPYSFLTDMAKNEPGLSSGLHVLDQLIADVVVTRGPQGAHRPVGIFTRRLPGRRVRCPACDQVWRHLCLQRWSHRAAGDRVELWRFVRRDTCLPRMQRF